jgi:aerobic-type carbon monoxide dehydrogenase small subunit (CoxS/CutS family)
MAEDDKSRKPDGAEPAEVESAPQKHPPVTRRDFLIRSNAGAVAVGVMTGSGFAAGLAQATARPGKPAPAADPITTRRVSLDIDGRKYDVTVDVRESLWETLNHQLGLSNCNLGCDRAQCGACTVVVDGRAVNGCTVLSARLGRGQKILTVGGLASGPGVEGLHPVQRAFWLEGGFQCGICTRGFVMSTYALLQVTRNPTDAQIKDALGGNICRCGEYPKILSAVHKAAAELRGERVSYTAPLMMAGAAAVEVGPTGAAVSREFVFTMSLGTIEDFDDLARELRQRPGIVTVSGSERTITIGWDPARWNEARVRRLLADAGHPVRP